MPYLTNHKITKKLRLKKKKKIPNTNGTTKGKAIVSEEMKSCQANVT